MQRKWISALVTGLAFCMLSLGCTGISTEDPTVPSDAGSLVVELGSDSFPGYANVVAGIESLDISADGTHWSSLGTVRRTFDLMSLQNGRPITLIDDVLVTPGVYSYFRIHWATTNYSLSSYPAAYVRPSGSSSNVAMDMLDTLVVGGSVTIPANGSAAAVLMLDGAQAVQVHSNVPYFQATGMIWDRSRVTSIQGQLTAGNTKLDGVEVYAELVDSQGYASVRRRAITDSNGNYVLDALPANGNVYWVTAQPAGATVAYAAKASTVTPSLIAANTVNLDYVTSYQPGTLTVSITPASGVDDGTWVELQEKITVPGIGAPWLIVRSQPVVTSLAHDSATFSGLAPGSYDYLAYRSYLGDVPNIQGGTSLADVYSGDNYTVYLSGF